MKTESKERVAKPSVAALVKGYVGFLTGTGKSLSTISSYKGDLGLFEKFLREKKRDFYRLAPRDLEAYQVWLEKNGMKMNTRRRKVLSAKALVKYAVSRKKVSALSGIQYVKTPERLERLPWIPSPAEFARLVEFVDTKTQTGLRNWLVVSLLAETGLTVAELCRLRWDALSEDVVSVEGEKRPRRLKISPPVVARLAEWRARNPGKHVFPGFNRHGITSEKMTPRGVELFFRVLARGSGLRALKPKTLRHYCIVDWLRAGVSDGEIQKRLGVHPNYSLAAYRKVLERDQAL
ncbi:MAG: tyrosine-type recombinase/integrase [Bdellovibrionota bacterium]